MAPGPRDERVPGRPRPLTGRRERLEGAEGEWRLGGSHAGSRALRAGWRARGQGQTAGCARSSDKQACFFTRAKRGCVLRVSTKKQSAGPARPGPTRRPKNLKLKSTRTAHRLYLDFNHHARIEGAFTIWKSTLCGAATRSRRPFIL